MTYARTHRSLIAWMLYAFILFNGLACSIGHGQMLGEFSKALGMSAMDCSSGHHGSIGKADLSMPAEHELLMKLSMTDCAFAGTLVFAFVLFLGISWLIRSMRLNRPTSEPERRKPPRHLFPGITPQAP